MKYLAILILLLLASCKSYVYQNINNFEKGMSFEKTVQTAFNEDYHSSLFEVNSVEDDTYDLGEGLKVLICKKYYPAQHEVRFLFFPIEDRRPYYLIAFKNDALLYWGLPNEFYQTNNDILVNIANRANTIINQGYE